MIILQVVLGLPLGYCLLILLRLRDRKEPGGSSFRELIPYIKLHDIESAIDVIALIVIGWIWISGELIEIPFPPSFGYAILVGLFSPELWARIMSIGRQIGEKKI